ncbi:MAG: hypothetical protein EOP04_01980 [Proteobacteria bacterium]|nr:MAG: hypothetical protein EOP04_01980 [Pseudomonadota bacterium]
MKTIIFTIALLSSAPVFASAANTTKTLSCTSSYALSSTDLGQTMPEIKRQLVKYKDLPTRRGAHEEFSTPDGFFQINVDAYQPLKGDFAKTENVIITIKDLRTGAEFVSGQRRIADVKGNVDHAVAVVSANSENGDHYPSLEVICDLN